MDSSTSTTTETGVQNFSVHVTDPLSFIRGQEYFVVLSRLHPIQMANLLYGYVRDFRAQIRHSGKALEQLFPRIASPAEEGVSDKRSIQLSAFHRLKPDDHEIGMFTSLVASEEGRIYPVFYKTKVQRLYVSGGPLTLFGLRVIFLHNPKLIYECIQNLSNMLNEIIEGQERRLADTKKTRDDFLKQLSRTDF